MRWTLWLVLGGLLLAAPGSPLAGRWDLVLLTALAVSLLCAGYGMRHRYRAQLFYHHENEAEPQTARATARTEHTMLNHDEQRRFHAIEELLEREDPEFADRIRALNRPGHPATGWLTAVVVLGLVIAAIGVLADPSLVVIGILVWASALAVRGLLTAPRQPRAARRSPDDDGPPPGSGRSAAV
ncbi:DUF3040 domain-containing protein [Saccharothrix isguenensis]